MFVTTATVSFPPVCCHSGFQAVRQQGAQSSRLRYPRFNDWLQSGPVTHCDKLRTSVRPMLAHKVMCRMEPLSNYNRTYAVTWLLIRHKFLEKLQQFHRRKAPNQVGDFQSAPLTGEAHLHLYMLHNADICLSCQGLQSHKPLLVQKEAAAA